VKLELEVTIFSDEDEDGDFRDFFLRVNGTKAFPQAPSTKRTRAETLFSNRRHKEQ
jgi:hypothetical protein